MRKDLFLNYGVVVMPLLLSGTPATDDQRQRITDSLQRLGYTVSMAGLNMIAQCTDNAEKFIEWADGLVPPQLAWKPLNEISSSINLTHVGAVGEVTVIHEDIVGTWCENLLKQAKLMSSEVEFILDNVDVIKTKRIANRDVAMMIASTRPKSQWKKYVRRPNDILRLVQYLNAGKIDLSDGTIPLGVSGPVRITLMNILQSLDLNRIDLQGDAMVQAGNWKRFMSLSRINNNQRRWPIAYAMFNSINDGVWKSIGQWEHSTTPEDIAIVAETFPGVFARNVLNFCSHDPVGVPELVTKYMANARADVLFRLRKQCDVMQSGDDRWVMAKDGSVRKIEGRVVHTQLLAQALDEILTSRFRGTCDFNPKDPLLMGTVLPSQEVEGVNVAQQRGDKVQFPHAKTIRGYLYWKGSVDIDLSAVMLDDDFNQVDSCWYGDTTRRGMQHSGDVLSAPNGAAEFIDIDAVNPKGRYVGLFINNYSSRTLENMTMITGVALPKSTGQNVQPEDRLVEIEIDSVASAMMLGIIDLLDSNFTYYGVQLPYWNTGSSVSGNDEVEKVLSFAKNSNKFLVSLGDVLEVCGDENAPFIHPSDLNVVRDAILRELADG